MWGAQVSVDFSKDKVNLGDKVIVKYTLGVDENNGVKVGDVAKVVYVDYDYDAWCFNPNWKLGNAELGGNFMRSDQIRRLE